MFREGVSLGTITDAEGTNGGGPLKVNTTAYPDGVSFVRTGDYLPARLTLARLQSLYRCTTRTVAGRTVTPMLPAAGSAERAVWLRMMEITEAELALGDYPCVVTSQRGQQIPANWGGVLPADVIIPHSVGAYIRQMTGFESDRRGSATLGSVGHALPYELNPDYGYGLVHLCGAGSPASVQHGEESPCWTLAGCRTSDRKPAERLQAEEV